MARHGKAAEGGLKSECSGTQMVRLLLGRRTRCVWIVKAEHELGVLVGEERRVIGPSGLASC